MLLPQKMYCAPYKVMLLCYFAVLYASVLIFYPLFFGHCWARADRNAHDQHGDGHSNVTASI